MDLQQIFEQLRPGDIILDKGDSFIAKAISYFDDSPYTHAMIYAGDNEVIHATRFGVCTKSVVDAFLYSEYFQVFRCIDRSIPLQKVVDKARCFEGRSYGTDQVVLLALILASSRVAYSMKVGAFARAIFEHASSLLMSYRDDDLRVTCSELVYRSFSEVCGKDVIEIDRGILKSNRTLNLLEEFSCYDAWMMSSKKDKSEAEIKQELLKLFEELEQEEAQLLVNTNANEMKTEIQELDAKNHFLNICRQVKNDTISQEKQKIKPLSNFKESLLTLFEANCNFLTPGDIARSPSLFPVFQEPIPLNRG